MNTPKTAAPQPRLCVVCDKPINRDPHRCTNSCCGECHTEFCTPGGNTEPGHGINIVKARITRELRS